jgi:hypothetical protein
MGWGMKLAEDSRGAGDEKMVWKGQTVRSNGGDWEFRAMSLGAFHPISRIHLISHSPANHSSGHLELRNTAVWLNFFPPAKVQLVM